MDLHGMHASTSYAQMPANFSSLRQDRSSSRLTTDFGLDDKSRASERLSTHGSFLSTGSPHHSLSNSSSRASIPNSSSKPCLSNASSRKSLGSLQSTESVEETEGESTPDHLGAKPKFTITTPEKKSYRAFDFDDVLSMQSIGKKPMDQLESDITVSRPDTICIDDVVVVEAIDIKDSVNESPELKSDGNGSSDVASRMDLDQPQKLGLKRSKFKLSLPKLTELPSLVKKEICKKCASWHDFGKGKTCNGSPQSNGKKKDFSDSDGNQNSSPQSKGCAKNKSHESTVENFKQINTDINILVDNLVKDMKVDDVLSEDECTNKEQSLGPVTYEEEFELALDQTVVEIHKCPYADDETDEKNPDEDMQYFECSSDNMPNGQCPPEDPSSERCLFKEDTANVDKCSLEDTLRGVEYEISDNKDDCVNIAADKPEVRGNNVEGCDEDILSKCPFFTGNRTDICNGTSSDMKSQSGMIDNRDTTETNERQVSLGPNGNACKSSNSVGKNLGLRNCNGTVSYCELKSLTQETPKSSSLSDLYEIHDIKCPWASKRAVEIENDKKLSRKPVSKLGDFQKTDTIVIFQISDDEDKGQS